MLPHSTMGIRIRRGKSKGYWWNARAARKEKKQEPVELPDEGNVEGVSNVFKKLLRGGK